MEVTYFIVVTRAQVFAKLLASISKTTAKLADSTSGTTIARTKIRNDIEGKVICPKMNIAIDILCRSVSK